MILLGTHGSGCLFSSQGRGKFQELFYQIVFLSLSLFFLTSGPYVKCCSRTSSHYSIGCLYSFFFFPLLWLSYFKILIFRFTDFFPFYLIFFGGCHVRYIDKVSWTVRALCEKLDGVEKQDFTQSHFRPRHIYPKVFPKTFCLRLGWLPQSRSKVKTLCPWG